ncbi:hypothetical protein AAF712_007789 [Marasmius tenuissimus]|uniref:Uncharacterized protein n=1 Tax=Marasmius tenuissimus TaxID=585030 RepID=A0ABR2ZYA9_9AGAR
MSDGRIEGHGSYQDLISTDEAFQRLDKEFGGRKEQEESDLKVHGATPVATENVKEKEKTELSDSTGTKSDGKLIRQENRKIGKVGWKVYRTYLKAGRAYITVPLLVASALLMQGSQIVSTYSLIWWQAE